MSSFHQPCGFKGDPSGLLYGCLREGRFAAAALLAKHLAQSERADVLFNLALADLAADSPAKALEWLDRALSACRRAAPVTAGVRPENYKKLRALELASGAPSPMSAEFVESFPDVARENIVVAVMEAAFRAGLPERVRAAAATLAGDEFDGVKRRLGV